MTHKLFYDALDLLIAKLRSGAMVEKFSAPPMATMKEMPTSRVMSGLPGMPEFGNWALFSRLVIFLENGWFKYLTEGGWSSVQWEKNILLLNSSDELIKRDAKRAFIWSFQFVRFVLRHISESKAFRLDGLQADNPLLEKYPNGFEKKATDAGDFAMRRFQFLRDFVNENSYAKDSANMWGLSWATDFLQLHKVVIELIPKPERARIAESVFDIFREDYPKNFDERLSEFKTRYDRMISILDSANVSKDRRISRLYNRLWNIFSFFLNNIYPETFPIFFSDTRSVLKSEWLADDYFGCAHAYWDFKTFFQGRQSETNGFLKRYVESVLSWLDNAPEAKFGYWVEGEWMLRKHVEYRFFQDVFWIFWRDSKGLSEEDCLELAKEHLINILWIPESLVIRPTRSGIVARIPDLLIGSENNCLAIVETKKWLTNLEQLGSRFMEGSIRRYGWARGWYLFNFSKWKYDPEIVFYEVDGDWRLKKRISIPDYEELLTMRQDGTRSANNDQIERH